MSVLAKLARRVHFVVLPGIALFAVATVAATRPIALQGYAEMRDADAWVDSHAANLPKTYDAFAVQPVMRRKSIYAALRSSEKEALWRAQLEAFVKPVAELSPEQKLARETLNSALSKAQVAFIRSSLDSLHTMFTDDVTDVERREIANRLCGFHSNLFTKDQAQAVFGMIGHVDATTNPSVALQAGMLGETASMLRHFAKTLHLEAKADVCSCDVGSLCSCDQCADNGCGCPGGPDCYECGCFIAFPCNGTCGIIPARD